MEQVFFLSSEKQGKYANIAECIWDGVTVIFKSAKYIDYSLECDLNALVRLKNANSLHFCKPIAKTVYNHIEGILLEKINGVLFDELITSETLKTGYIYNFISMFEQTLMAIIIMHKNNITHNDLHMKNIIASTCETPYFIYSFGGSELFCVETFGTQSVLIDFGLASVKYANYGMADDNFTYLGYTLNGELEFRRDFIHLGYNVLRYLNKYLANERVYTRKLLIFKYIRFVKYILTGVRTPVNNDLFESNYFPCFNSMIGRTIPILCLKHYTNDVLIDIAHLCKTTVLKPFRYKNYTKIEMTECWIDLVKTLHTTEPLAHIKSVLEGEIDDPILIKHCKQLGLFAASIAAKCYEIIYTMRDTHYKYVLWKDGIDLLLHLPVKAFIKKPQLNDAVIVQDVLKKTIVKTVFTQSMLNDVYNLQRIFKCIEVAKANIGPAANHYLLESIIVKQIIVEEKTNGLIYYKYKS
ncbi:Phosphotransferase [Lymphocystis disease virus 1]|uniref:Phosphotransferase n=1 Tax=Fish lymphocystis disease virus TaxID=36363 RepID=UPI0000161EAE|nr:Phosphotransferase [Lymphocystis disease virus 1]